jgi:hypothetical protein
MPRFFTLEQAEKVLPDVDSALRRIMSLKAEYEVLQSEWQSFSEHLVATGGMRVDRSRVMERKNSREEAALALKQAVDKVHEFGCVVKDLDIGLIDFPTLFQGEEVYLCWKLGEVGIRFWHGVNEGFRGRKPIDSGFLEHHRGELPN